jgi:type IV fimbrial biogenesis protein FimT
MNPLNQEASKRRSAEALQRHGASCASTLQRPNASWPHLVRVRLTKKSPASTHHASCFTPQASAFTLIELILVLALLVVITSIAAPAMARFIRGRALDTEARQIVALMHLAQSRAVSEGAPMMLWVNASTGGYGVAAETSGQDGDPKAENLTVDSTLTIAVLNSTGGTPITFHNLPAIRFQPDGTVDENSPQTLKLTDSDGFARWLVQTRLRTGYEVSLTAQ